MRACTLEPDGYPPPSATPEGSGYTALLDVTKWFRATVPPGCATLSCSRERLSLADFWIFEQLVLECQVNRSVSPTTTSCNELLFGGTSGCDNDPDSAYENSAHHDPISF